MKSIICFVAMLVSMLALDMTGDMVLKVYMKALTSILFVLTGICALRERAHERGFCTGYAKLILLGLIFGCVGDVILELADLKGTLYFVTGLVIFALGHVFYLIAFFAKSPFRWFNLLPTLLVIPAVLIAVPLTGAFEFNPDVLFYAVIVYGCILTFMVGKSLSFIEFKEHPAFVRMTIVGTILFAISDFTLLFLLFFKPIISLPQDALMRYILRVFFLLTYYLGQGLIALSLRKEP